MKTNLDVTLYLVTDRRLMRAKTLEEAVEKAILGGCTMVQLREKEVSGAAFYGTACRVKEITDRYRVPLIINDRVDIALAVDADGVHVGQSDLQAGVVRQLIGDKLLGVSAANIAQAVKAVSDGADYIGVGAMYPTYTKTDAVPVTIAELKAIRTAVSVPIVVIGGINEKTVSDLAGTGIDGLAVVSAVIAQDDISGAARRLVRLFNRECRV